MARSLLLNKSTPTLSPTGRDAATAVDSGKKQTHPDLILAICCMSLLVVGMDVTIVNVALPSIQRDLHATVSGLQWILDAYTLVIASLLMLAGSPICLTAVVLAARFVPESKAPRARAFDPIGQVLVFVGLASLTYAVIEGPHAGWHSSRILGLFVTSGAALALFLFYEPRREQPLLDLRFFRSVPFSSAALLAVCAFASFAGFLFLNALYLQQVRGLSAFHTGLCTLPLAIAMMVCAPLSGRLVGRHGPRPSLLSAGAGFLLSTWMLTRLTVSTPLVLIMVVYVLFGIGLGMVNPAITNSAVAGMPLTQAGVAAAIASTGRQVGAALGVAVAGTVVTASRANGSDFTQATHPIWWIMTGCSAIVLLLGWVSTTAWAHASTERVASLLGHSGR